MTIYFVDDDINQIRPFVDELELQGYKVLTLRNADEALGFLTSLSEEDGLLSFHKETDCVIYDVMLGTGPGETSAFSREETGDFLMTGLALIEKLIAQNKGTFEGRGVMFSMSAHDHVLQKIAETSEKYNLPSMKKSDYPDPAAFAQALKDLNVIPSTQSLTMTSLTAPKKPALLPATKALGEIKIPTEP